MDYKEAWKFLDNLQFFKIKLGLDSMTKFLGRLGHPEKKLQFVHVGGTNGKGSVSKTILTILAEAGFKVGLYTSPHFTSVRERFTINTSFISEDDFAANASMIFDILAGEQITYFEFTTALALQWFAEQEVDLAILEVGMGGRLDATNIVTPLVAIITNVSMDHEDYLGQTLAAVAVEKAGIIKAGVPLVSGVKEDAARSVIRQRASELNTPILELDTDFKMIREGECWRYESASSRAINEIKIALRGDYQGGNAALALAAVDILAKAGFSVSDNSIRQAMPEVSWPGRLEYFSHSVSGVMYNFLLDGAHNPAGVQALVAELKKLGKKNIIMVWASMADKNFGRCLRLIAPLCKEIIFTRPEENRSATPEQLQPELRDFQGGCHAIVPVSAALDKAYQLAGRDDLICVAGSLYLVGKARAILLGEVTDV
jgi:dihydrofolate synthase/folylpolyglutamate synthase